MMDLKPEHNDAPFNMAQMFYIELGRLKEYKNNAWLAGDLVAYCTALQAIATEIFFQIKDKGKPTKNDKKEMDSVDEKLEKAQRILSSPPPPAHLAAQVQRMQFWTARKTLNEADREIGVLMEKYKMIFPRIDAKIGFKKLDEKYKLGGK